MRIHIPSVHSLVLCSFCLPLLTSLPLSLLSLLSPLSPLSPLLPLSLLPFLSPPLSSPSFSLPLSPLPPLLPSFLLPKRDLYTEGQRHYFAEEWNTMIEKFELALEEFYPALEKCRQLCNGPLRYTKTLDFAQVLEIDGVHCHVLATVAMTPS